MKFVSCSLTTLGVLACTSLVGCGTVQAPGTQAATSEIDLAQVNAINNVARSRGVQVFWVNYPRKVVRSGPGSPGDGS